MDLDARKPLPPLELDTSREDVHQERLAAWRRRHPGSPHAYLDLAALAALKAENERLAERERRERPDVCAAYPTLMTIGNTHKCNLTCNMCFKQLDQVDNMSLPDMGWERFASLGHELFPHLHTVALTVSGEPLISRTIFDELDLLATYGVRASLTTNGMPLARKGLMEHLLPALGTLVVSMDGASEPVFNAIRRGALFPRVLENLRRFNEAREALPRHVPRPRLEFSHILQWRNVAELPRLIELAHAFAVDQVAVDYAYIHAGLNDADSLDRHRELANRSLDEAQATAQRLGVRVLLPERLAIPAGHVEAPYEPLDAETLLEQGRERLETLPFDPLLHERLDQDPASAEMLRVQAEGGDNAVWVERLLERGVKDALRWGVPQLGPSLMPPGREKVSPCLYPWRESYVDFNGVVAPCCNPSMSAGRVMGHYESGDSFREVWNNRTYQELRRSLSSGRSFKFCRYCYVVESANEARWGSEDTWYRMRVVLTSGVPVAAGQVPEKKRLVLSEVRSGPAVEGARLEIAEEGEVRVTLEARREADGSWGFARTLETPFAAGKVVYLRCLGIERLDVELVGSVS